jgi:hypothetical protein
MDDGARGGMQPRGVTAAVRVRQEAAEEHPRRRDSGIGVLRCDRRLVRRLMLVSRCPSRRGRRRVAM